MIFNKKAMEMTLSTIVIAVMVLLVLVVLSFIFFRSSNTFSDGLSVCTGDCVMEAGECEIKDVPAIPMKCKLGGYGSSSSDSLGNYCCKGFN